jgi:hypothetical protein
MWTAINADLVGTNNLDAKDWHKRTALAGEALLRRLNSELNITGRNASDVAIQDVAVWLWLRA